MIYILEKTTTRAIKGAGGSSSLTQECDDVAVKKVDELESAISY